MNPWERLSWSQEGADRGLRPAPPRFVAVSIPVNCAAASKARSGLGTRPHSLHHTANRSASHAMPSSLGGAM
jgi:hypothetical protein